MLETATSLPLPLPPPHKAATRHPIGTEGRIFTRLLGVAVRDADDAYMAGLQALTKPLRDRLAKHPDRMIRTDLVSGLVRELHRLEPSWRLGLAVSPLDKQVFALADYRVTGAEFLDRAWADPEWQQSIALCRVALTASGATGVQIKTTILGHVSGHATGRFFERCPRHAYADLVHDLKPLLLSDAVEYVASGHGDGYWIGPIRRTESPDGRQFKTRFVQSYIAAESLPDDPPPARADRSAQPAMTPA